MQQLYNEQLKEHINKGALIAYPTEAVWGLGCNPLQPEALQKLLNIKQRNSNKGFIIVAANIEQLEPYVNWDSLTSEQYQTILSSWPGPSTWIVPAKPNLPALLTGSFDTIAVRVSNHPTIIEICNCVGAITSTSANRSGLEPCKNLVELMNQFSNELNLNYIFGTIGDHLKPTEIRDAQTGKIIRHGS